MIRALHVTEDELQRLRFIAGNCGLKLDPQRSFIATTVGIDSGGFEVSRSMPDDSWLLSIIARMALRIEYLEHVLHIKSADAVEGIEAQKAPGARPAGSRPNGVA